MRPQSIVLILLMICSVQDALASLASKNTRWDKTKITVCWANWNETHNQLWLSKASFIQTTVEKEFNARTPLKFIGWKPCSETNVADAVLSFDFRESDSNSSRASIGRGDQPDQNNLYSFVYLSGKKNSSHQEMLELKQSLIHEFGHLAGLAHEHLRSEAQNDPNCLASGNYQRIKSEKMPTHISLIEIGEYDPHSIMNYCFNSKMSKEGLDDKLSVGDIRTLQELYAE